MLDRRFSLGRVGVMEKGFEAKFGSASIILHFV